MRILVTGSKGMIGRHLVNALIDAGNDVVGLDRINDSSYVEHYFYNMVDLGDKETLRIIKEKYSVDRIIHLAGLAHTQNEEDLSWERYKYVNVECAKNVFDIAGDIPVLFISTVDVFGFSSGGYVTAETELHPVTFYGKSKAMAEEECKKLKHYDIFRFSPVYTDEIKRDIQKRYYLKYPNVAYRIGKGTEYEILNVKRAIAKMVDWCYQEPQNTIRIVKDPNNMNTVEYIKAEKSEGRARVVLHFPTWMVNVGYAVLKGITGENKYTYLLNKAVHPLRSK